MWRLVSTKRSRELIGFFAAGAAAIIAGGWAVFVYLAPAESKQKSADCMVEAKDSAVSCGDIRGNININSSR